MTSSHERKAVGLHLFCVLLPHLAPADVPVVFSGAFARTLSSSLAGSDTYLHKGAARCIHRMVNWAEHSSENGSRGMSSAACI